MIDYHIENQDFIFKQKDICLSNKYKKMKAQNIIKRIQNSQHSFLNITPALTDLN